jgi:hypothetical protein
MTSTEPPPPPWLPPPPPEPPRRRPWVARHKVLTGLGALFALLVVLVVAGAADGGGGQAGNGSAASSDPASSAPATLDPTGGPTDDPTPPAGPATTIPGDGTFLVGTDIKPGTYRSPMPESGNCYWARMSDVGDDLGGIIANDNSAGPSVVTIRATDKAFTTTGCEPWTLAP